MLNKLKAKLKNCIRRWSANSRLKNVILLESVPDVSDNTKAVFEEMLRRKLNKRYKLIWSLTQEGGSYPKIKNVQYLHWQSAKEKYYKQVAKVKICCNRFLNKTNEKQLCIYLSHGTTIKSVKAYHTIPAYMDYFVVSSQGVLSSQANEFNFPEEKTVALGFPRNDELTGKPVDVRTMLQTTAKKIVIWYPTYRQHTNGTKPCTSEALPIIHDTAMAEKLNEVAKAKDVLLVLKPHFAQDVSYVKDLGLSHIRFIDDTFFVKNKVTSYQFVSSCDALLTDYSSIYLDYTLCNKPIGVIWEDIEEYKQSPGFIADYEKWMKGAEKLYTLEDLTSFVERISDGIDVLKREREEIRDFANISTDGKNSERVVDFIIEKANLKV